MRKTVERTISEDVFMVNFTINDKILQVEEGRTILEVALEQGIDIPTLCYHKELTPYGACRLCLVEIVAGGRPTKSLRG